MSALEGWLAPVGSRIAFLILATFSGVVFAPFQNLGLDRQRWTCSPLTVSWCPKASRQSLQQLGWFYLLFWSFCSCTRSIGWQLQSDQPSDQCLGSKLFQRLSSMTQQGRAPEVLQRLIATQGWNPCTVAPLSQDLYTFEHCSKSDMLPWCIWSHCLQKHYWKLWQCWQDIGTAWATALKHAQHWFQPSARQKKSAHDAELECKHSAHISAGALAKKKEHLWFVVKHI